MAAELKNMMICLQQLRAIVYLLGVTGGGQVELLAALPPQLSLFSVSGGAQPSLFNKHRWWVGLESLVLLMNTDY